MRPNVNARRSTLYVDQNLVAKNSTFLLRPDPVSTWGDYLSLLRTWFTHTCVSVIVLLTLIWWPVTQTSVLMGYLPLLCLCSIPFWAERLNLPMIFGYVVFAVLLLGGAWLSGVRAATSSDNVALLLFVDRTTAIMFGVAIVQTAIPFVTKILPAANTGFASLLVVIIGVGTIEAAAPRVLVCESLAVLSAAFLAACLGDSYALRVASSPNVSVGASLALQRPGTFVAPWSRMAILRWVFRVRKVAVIVAALALGGIALTFPPVELANAFLQNEWLRTWLCIDTAIVLLSFRLIANCPMVQTGFNAISGALEAFVLWELDYHSGPAGTGIYTVSHFDVLGIPVRSRMTLIASVLMTLAVIHAHTGANFDVFRAAIEAKEFYKAPLVVLPYIAIGQAVLAVLVIVLSGPDIAITRFLATNKFVPRMKS